MSESAYQAELLVELNKIPGVRVERRNVGSVQVAGTNRWFHAGPPKGACDIGGVAGPGGWAVYVECKVKGRKRSPEQIAYAEMVQGHGAIYELADEKTRSVAQVVTSVRAELERRRGETVLDAPLIRRLGQRRTARDTSHLLPGEKIDFRGDAKRRAACR